MIKKLEPIMGVGRNDEALMERLFLVRPKV